MPTFPAVVIIPAYNEEPGIARVIADIPRDLISETIVVDNGSTDRTAMKAREAGARVISQPDRGYGAACLAGIAGLPPGTQVVLFLDGDYSDDPAQAKDLLQALEEHQADLVLGSRTRGGPEPGSLTPQQRFGNWLSTFIIGLIYGHAYTDLGPFAPFGGRRCPSSTCRIEPTAGRWKCRSRPCSRDSRWWKFPSATGLAWAGPRCRGPSRGPSRRDSRSCGPSPG